VRYILQEVDEKLEALRNKKAKTLFMNDKMPETIIEIHSSEEFNKMVKDYPNKVIIIDFWAIWCGPCMFFGPIFKKLHEEFKRNFLFAKVNVDENNAIARNYGITGIPTTLFIKNDEVINKIVGAMNYDGMKNILNELKD